jgi:hypothetical protein
MQSSRGIFAGDLVQHIDFPGRSSARSINLGRLSLLARDRIFEMPGTSGRNPLRLLVLIM